MCRPTLIAGHKAGVEFLPENLPLIYIIVKKLNSLKHLARTTVAESHN